MAKFKSKRVAEAIKNLKDQISRIEKEKENGQNGKNELIEYAKALEKELKRGTEKNLFNSINICLKGEKETRVLRCTKRSVILTGIESRDKKGKYEWNEFFYNLSHLSPALTEIIEAAIEGKTTQTIS